MQNTEINISGITGLAQLIHAVAEARGLPPELVVRRLQSVFDEAIDYAAAHDMRDPWEALEFFATPAGQEYLRQTLPVNDQAPAVKGVSHDQD